MSTLSPPEPSFGLYHGLRMTADEFMSLPDDGHFYELLEGIVVMSPSPKPIHQQVAVEIVRQLATYLLTHQVGRVFSEIDVQIGEGLTGGDLVYRPEAIFVLGERLAAMRDKIVGPPDMVLEIISQGSRQYDTRTKKDDYERFGVREYWLADPERKLITFYRLEQGKFVEVAADEASFRSEAVPGFVLDLALVRQMFEPW